MKRESLERRVSTESKEHYRELLHIKMFDSLQRVGNLSIVWVCVHRTPRKPPCAMLVKENRLSGSTLTCGV